MNSTPSNPSAENFTNSLAAAGGDEVRLGEMLDEAVALLASEYAEQLRIHEDKVSLLKKREAAAEQRVAEAESMLTLGSPAATVPLRLSLPQMVEAALIGLPSGKDPTEIRLQAGLPLVSLFDKVTQAPAGNASEEELLAMSLEKLASALAGLHIHEFNLTERARVDGQIISVVRTEQGTPGLGDSVKSTLKNGFQFQDDDGRPVCLRKAVIECFPAN